MKSTTMKAKETKGFTLEIEAPKVGNFLPIQVQIALKARMRHCDKSRTRNKSKKWRKEA